MHPMYRPKPPFSCCSVIKPCPVTHKHTHLFLRAFTPTIRSTTPCQESFPLKINPFFLHPNPNPVTHLPILILLPFSPHEHRHMKRTIHLQIIYFPNISLS